MLYVEYFIIKIMPYCLVIKSLKVICTCEELCVIIFYMYI